jgi:hypothetical protein
MKNILFLLLSVVLWGTVAGAQTSSPSGTPEVVAQGLVGLTVYPCKGEKGQLAKHTGPYDGWEALTPMQPVVIKAAQLEARENSPGNFRLTLHMESGNGLYAFDKTVYAGGDDVKSGDDLRKSLFGSHEKWREQPVDLFIHKGLSYFDLTCGKGQPDSENNYGDGGMQLIYNDGDLIVYTDSDFRVSTIQKFNQ